MNSPASLVPVAVTEDLLGIVSRIILFSEQHRTPSMIRTLSAVDLFSQIISDSLLLRRRDSPHGPDFGLTQEGSRK